jgi:hypothetical protein
MRIVVPFVIGMLRDETALALVSRDADVTWARIHRHDGEAYARLVEELWRDGEAFCIVEQDVVPTPAMLDGLEQCPEPWCSHCYAGPNWPREAMLGLVRFSAELLRRRTEVGVSVLRTDRTRTHHVGWRSLNETMSRHLSAHGEPWHRHLPNVIHLRPRCSQ